VKPPAAPARKKVVKTAAVSEGEDGEEDLSLEARVALLEVENETLKAENRELRKKLVEALRRPAPSTADVEPRGGAKEREDKPEEKKSRRRPQEDAEEAPRRKKDEAAEPSGSARRGGGEPPAARAEEPPRRAPREDARAQAEAEAVGNPEDDMNAVLLCNAQMEVYNESIPNNIPPEKRLPMVNAKLDRFMASFDEKIQIIELKSGGIIIKDRKTFQMRYSCVFRESGSKLKGVVNKRFYYDGPSNKPTYALDFETHESLVTATPGTPPDGKLGVREARVEHLAVLYEEKGNKITRMWLRPDTDKLGLDPMAGESIMERSETVKAFEEKVKELRGGLGSRIFHNYHQMVTVG